MKINSTLLILALFAGVAGNCQKNLTPGYIVDNKNDTTNGFIDYREWYKNPESILFTSSKEKGLQKFLITDVSNFSISGKEQYKRYSVNISMARNNVSDIGGRDTAQRKDTVWLKVLLAGKNVQLFSYADDIKSRLYVLSSDEAVPVELKNTEYLSDGQLVSEKEYKNILLANAKKYAPENISLKNKIYTTGFYKNDIIDICYTINGIDKDDIKTQAKKEKSNRFAFWAGIGMNKGQIEIQGDRHYAGSKSNTLSPLFAGGFNILINPNTGRMFAGTDVSYTTYKADAFASVQYFASKESYYFKFKQANIALNETLNYNLYNGKSFKYFIGAGAGMNFSSYPLNQQIFVRETKSDTTTIINKNYFEFTKGFWLSGIIRTGISVKNVEASVSYIPGSTISSYKLHAMRNSSVRLQLNYLFKN
ncbi:MAG TPA: hypothetical protein VFW07_12990 [Parafilimonas sp.]|nr:hypothetical protein [Parafilimonas sp.]